MFELIKNIKADYFGKYWPSIVNHGVAVKRITGIASAKRKAKKLKNRKANYD